MFQVCMHEYMSIPRHLTNAPSDPAHRPRKPSKRSQQIDPLLPLTPARPKHKPRGVRVPAQASEAQPTTPPGRTFAAEQIHGSKNRQAASVLFTPRSKQPSLAGRTPRSKQPTGRTPACQPHPASQRRPHRQSSPTPHSNIPDSDSLSEEEELRAGLTRLDLSSRSSSGSPSPQTNPRREAPKAPAKRKSAKDVRTFFTLVDGIQACEFCKCVSDIFQC
jgi:hypothetical protein